MTPEQKRALQLIAEAVVECVAAFKDRGAPAGPLYAQLMSFGCTLAQFEQLMAALVVAGKLRKEGHLYFSTGGQHGSNHSNQR